MHHRSLLAMSYGRGNNECRIYVGNLPPDIRTKDIEDLFYKFGKIVFIDLKNRRGPPFAFVEFEDPRLVWRNSFSGLVCGCVCALWIMSEWWVVKWSVDVWRDRWRDRLAG